ncbi:MAG: N-6 DNA methylase [Planctomycetota bacterium]|jgi:hypothetical protein
MKVGKKYRSEFGDFQTPKDLARRACATLARLGLRPSAILEPNCGKGNFLMAAIEQFRGAKDVFGVEINAEYVRGLQSLIEQNNPDRMKIRIVNEDFFKVKWHGILESLPDPLLIVGNPPWITNADLGSIGGTNLPTKSNFQNRRGLDAITGKSNFDISEWMLMRELEWMQGRQATLAMLCKTTVARKVLHYAWKSGMPVGQASIHLINAPKHFAAAVDACLLVVSASADEPHFNCRIYESLEAQAPTDVFGYRDKQLVSSVERFDRWQHLQGPERYKWRSGIKHDCAKIMELRKEDGRYRNGFGELVELDADYVYPMLKSSDVANGRASRPVLWMLVTQQHIGENTRLLQKLAPRTWDYLSRHGDLLDRRGSSVYRNRPRFSMFGVGDYSFARWKVAVSGLYKKLRFTVVGPFDNKPVVLDDTCYFIACRSKEEAFFVGGLLNSEIANEFFSAFIFWDAKRPITLSVLRRLDILALARAMNVEEELNEFLDEQQRPTAQMSLFS